MQLTTKETAQKMHDNGVVKFFEDLNLEELYQCKKELKELISKIPDSKPEVLANFKEDLDEIEKTINKL